MNLVDHLDKLRAFEVIVEAGSMREAAQILNVTQPSLTRLIQSLEEAAGVELLSRGRQGVAPTEAGLLLLKYARSILKDLHDLEERLKNPTEPMAGSLRIGAYTSLAEYLWPDFIPAFRKAAPQLKLSVRTSEAFNHMQALKDGQIDILVDAEPRYPGELMSWSLYEDRFNFYMNPRHAQDWTPETIGALTVITCPAAYDQNNKRISQHLEAEGYFFSESIELDSFTSVMSFAKKDLGLAILPERLAEASVKAGQLTPVRLKNFPAKGFGPHTFMATIVESRRNDARLKLLIRELKNWFR